MLFNLMLVVISFSLQNCVFELVMSVNLIINVQRLTKLC